MMRCLIVVEGPSDAAFLGKLLLARQFAKAAYIHELSDAEWVYWGDLMKVSSPVRSRKGDKLSRVLPVPDLYCRTGDLGTDSLALHSADGYEKVAVALLNALEVLDPAPAALGIAVDADQRAPADRLSDLQMRIQKEAMDRQVADPWGSVQNFVFPDGCQSGMLEDALLDGVTAKYQDLVKAAESYVDLAKDLDRPRLIENGKSANLLAKRSKAVCGAMAAAIEPGASLSAAIAAAQWFDAAAREPASLAAAQQFLDRLGL